MQHSTVERRGHIPVLELLLRSTAGRLNHFRKIRMIVMMKRREKEQMYEDGGDNDKQALLGRSQTSVTCLFVNCILADLALSWT